MSIHQKDQSEIERLHGLAVADIHERLIPLQDASYELGFARGLAAGQAVARTAVHFADLSMSTKLYDHTLTDAGRLLPPGKYRLMAVPMEQEGKEAFEVPTMNHVARRKLGELLADGHQVCGVMIARQNSDGTETRGAVSAGGLVIWWHAP
jgi:hypothetical protein